MKIKRFKNKYLKFFMFLLFFGFILSFLYFQSLSKNDFDKIIILLKTNKTYLHSLNNIIEHVKILSLILLFSLVFIGLPIYIGLIISEGFTLFLRSIFLYKLYRFNGVIYSLIYYLINNGIYLILIYFLFKKIFRIIKIIYKYKIKQETIKFDEIFHLIINGVIIIIFILINDILVYFYAGKLLKVFAFLLN